MCSGPGQAGGTGPQGAESFETVKKEFQDARKAFSTEFRAAYEEAKKNGKEKDFKFDKPHPAALFSPRFLAIAEKNPEGPDAIEALKLTLQTSNGPKPAPRSKRAPKPSRSFSDYYVAKPSIKGFLDMLTMYDDDDSRALVAEVIARNPDRKVQAAAYKGQVAPRRAARPVRRNRQRPQAARNDREGEGKDFVRTARQGRKGEGRARSGSRRRSGRNTATSSPTFPSAARPPRSRSRPSTAARRAFPH